MSHDCSSFSVRDAARNKLILLLYLFNKIIQLLDTNPNRENMRNYECNIVVACFFIKIRLCILDISKVGAHIAANNINITLMNGEKLQKNIFNSSIIFDNLTRLLDCNSTIIATMKIFFSEKRK